LLGEGNLIVSLVRPAFFIFAEIREEILSDIWRLHFFFPFCFFSFQGVGW